MFFVLYLLPILPYSVLPKSLLWLPVKFLQDHQEGSGATEKPCHHPDGGVLFIIATSLLASLPCKSIKYSQTWKLSSRIIPPLYIIFQETSVFIS